MAVVCFGLISLDNSLVNDAGQSVSVFIFMSNIVKDSEISIVEIYYRAIFIHHQFLHCFTIASEYV